MQVRGQYIPVKDRPFIKSNGFDVAIKEWIANRTSLTNHPPTLDYIKSIWGVFRIAKMINEGELLVCDENHVIATPEMPQTTLRKLKYANTIIR